MGDRMSRPGSTHAKREREQARTEQSKAKLARRAQRKQEKEDRPEGDDGEDPDIAGIIPGPQPPRTDDY